MTAFARPGEGAVDDALLRVSAMAQRARRTRVRASEREGGVAIVIETRGRHKARDAVTRLAGAAILAAAELAPVRRVVAGRTPIAPLRER